MLITRIVSVVRTPSFVHLVEQFHLLFLAQLGRRVHPSLFVLKGGCNLRFFHGSVRYSEDLDLDVRDIGTQTLRERVRGVFASRPFAEILEARGVFIDRVSEPKQTETTQRWKLGLRVEGAGASLPTKIECSRRGLDDGVVFGSVEPSVIRVHRTPPLMLSHYDAATALLQKIGALAGRRETQARDVFDAHHLLAVGSGSLTAGRLDRDVADRASANAMAIDFSTFKSQVLAFLLPEDQVQFDSSSVWDTIVLEVVDALREAAP
jgi:predicted nucleotidyltransferase component of viral defense system